MLFSDHHLAKLNPNCHKNYSIIFTEISFSPETSNWNTKEAKIQGNQEDGQFDAKMHYTILTEQKVFLAFLTCLNLFYNICLQVYMEVLCWVYAL